MCFRAAEQLLLLNCVSGNPAEVSFCKLLNVSASIVEVISAEVFAWCSVAHWWSLLVLAQACPDQSMSWPISLLFIPTWIYYSPSASIQDPRSTGYPALFNLKEYSFQLMLNPYFCSFCKMVSESCITVFRKSTNTECDQQFLQEELEYTTTALHSNSSSPER